MVKGRSRGKGPDVMEDNWRVARALIINRACVENASCIDKGVDDDRV